MKIRTFTGVVLSIIIIPIIYFSDYWIYPAFISLLSVLSVYEMQRCIGTLHLWSLSIPSFCLAIISPIFARLFSEIQSFVMILAVAILIIVIYYLIIFVLSFGKYHFENMATSLMTTIYIVSAFSSLVLLRNVSFGNYYVVLAFAAPWVSDIFAYLTGKFLGKHKLIEKVSPKKTIEGAIGGILFTIIFCLIYTFIVANWYDVSLMQNYIGSVLVGIILSLGGQVGDLIASAIKRQFGIKDYGKLLPGHGGILDRFDSVMMTGFIILLFTSLSNYIAIFQV